MLLTETGFSSSRDNALNRAFIQFSILMDRLQYTVQITVEQIGQDFFCQQLEAYDLSYSVEFGEDLKRRSERFFRLINGKVSKYRRAFFTLVFPGKELAINSFQLQPY